MIHFLLRLFAVIVFLILVFTTWIDPADTWDWAFGAFAAWAASGLAFPDVAVPVATVRRDPPA